MGTGTANFEARLFEDNSRIEIVFSQVDDGAASATVGIQHPTNPSVQFSCNTAGLVRLRHPPYVRVLQRPHRHRRGPPPIPSVRAAHEGPTLLTVHRHPGHQPAQHRHHGHRGPDSSIGILPNGLSTTTGRTVM